MMDSKEGSLEEVSEVGGLGGVLSLFAHPRHQGHVCGIQSEGLGNEQGPGSLFLALPMPEGG